MPHPHDCPTWEYKNHANYGALPRLCQQAVAELRRSAVSVPHTTAIACDGRSVHLFLFSGLAPDGCPYFAGHYRGEPFRCLRFNRVGIGNDARVGSEPQLVERELAYLSQTLKDGLSLLRTACSLPDVRLPKIDKIYYVVTFACRVFVEFLRIHPYCNGNGHLARFLVWVLLGHFGFWPKRWPVHDRPPDPPYSDLISQYRDGDRESLETFVMKCVLGTV
jgi:hypothetical protein